MCSKERRVPMMAFIYTVSDQCLTFIMKYLPTTDQNMVHCRKLIYWAIFGAGPSGQCMTQVFKGHSKRNPCVVYQLPPRALQET
ncbi:hypothetical protein GDO78_009939 [Eleutherodactylus coqui]|uniref:Uncharacterized protein n=1 Tax=Eleutherodactylus coqui TaxID=57060 RepID=A0A8J6F9Z9_ELECQ|nr:hypothetical protein GDO78_009939 [Eleutherodactylus coqui]